MNQEEQRKLAIKCNADEEREFPSKLIFYTFGVSNLAAYTAAVEAPLQARIVSVFSEDEHPEFKQGQADHELLEDVTAEYCTNLVNIIKERNQNILEQQARIEELVNQLGYEAQQMSPKYCTQALSEHDKEVKAKERERCAVVCQAYGDEWARLKVGAYDGRYDMMEEAASILEDEIRELK